MGEPARPGDRQLLVTDEDALSGTDLAIIDVLAQLALIARRMGCRLVLRRVSSPLQRLLDLSGLSEVDGVLVVEPVRQSEEWEHAVGVEEEGEPDDLTG